MTAADNPSHFFRITLLTILTNEVMGQDDNAFELCKTFENMLATVKTFDWAIEYDLCSLKLSTATFLTYRYFAILEKFIGLLGCGTNDGLCIGDVYTSNRCQGKSNEYFFHRNMPLICLNILHAVCKNCSIY